MEKLTAHFRMNLTSKINNTEYVGKHAGKAASCSRPLPERLDEAGKGAIGRIPHDPTCPWFPADDRWKSYPGRNDPIAFRSWLRIHLNFLIDASVRVAFRPWE